MTCGKVYKETVPFRPNLNSNSNLVVVFGWSNTKLATAREIFSVRLSLYFDWFDHFLWRFCWYLPSSILVFNFDAWSCNVHFESLSLSSCFATAAVNCWDSRAQSCNFQQMTQTLSGCPRTFPLVTTKVTEWSRTHKRHTAQAVQTRRVKRCYTERKQNHDHNAAHIHQKVWWSHQITSTVQSLAFQIYSNL